MQELRLVAVSEDGTYLVLATAGRGTRFTLPVDDRLRAAVRGHFSRLGQFEIEVESPLRPKEIQARIRSGETAEEIAESAGIPVERVRWFEGPVLQEREYMAQQAQRVAVRRPGESAPGPPLGETVEERLGRGGVDLEEVEWDSWKCEDSTWRVRLSFFDNGRPHAAEWVFDPRRRQVSPLDEVAARLTSVEWDDSLSDTVTPLVPRRPAMKVVSDREQQRPEALREPGARREHDARREYIVERGRMVDPRPQVGAQPETPREPAATARLEPPPAVRVAAPATDAWDDDRPAVHEATREERPAPLRPGAERPAPAAVPDERAARTGSRDERPETTAARDERPAAREEERPAAGEDELAAARDEQASAAQEERATMFARQEKPAEPTPVEDVSAKDEEPSMDEAASVHEEASAPTQDEGDARPVLAAAEAVEQESATSAAPDEDPVVKAADVPAADIEPAAEVSDTSEEDAQEAAASDTSARPAADSAPVSLPEVADEVAPKPEVPEPTAQQDEPEAAAEADDEAAATPEPVARQSEQQPAEQQEPQQQAPKPQPPRHREAARTPAKKKPAGRPAMPGPDKPVTEPAAAAGAEPAPAPQRPAARNRRKAKGKRASVPSWDEIMFGARRPE
ncbi:septation protein SepH [Spirillospora sp. NPDC048911]|uniref:septation protein SepH n=1 Tax=Spirillospora sp. NPDC048911 TaxID=3364527 RepID=UPI0037138F82